MRVGCRIGIVIGAMLLVTSGCSLNAPDGPSRPQRGPSGAVSQAETLSPAGQQQLRGLLERGRLEDLQWPNFSDYDSQISIFYEKSGFGLEWSRNGKPTRQALDLIGILEQAENKGLDAKDYDGDRWPSRVKALGAVNDHNESALLRFDLALTVSAMRYASDLHLGKIDPRTLHTAFEPERSAYDLCDFLLNHVAAGADVQAAFAKIEPAYQEYQRLLVALQKYLQLAREEKPNLLPTVPQPLAPGQTYAAVPQLVERLKFLGDMPADEAAEANGDVYQGKVVEGVRRFQDRHGLEADGKLGPQTILELNRPMSDRVKQLQLALERWRWVPHNFEHPPIAVNIPEFALRAYDEDGTVKLTMRVVVGRALRTQTPVMQEDMKYVIFWPYWNVPPSILRYEIIPKVQRDRSYLLKEAFEVTTTSGQVVTDGVVSDEVYAELRAGRLLVRQKPGTQNALGFVKFVFPNDNNIYLHDTPAQKLFGRSRRDFSHGCIRAQEPAKLAEWVLRNNPGWTAERINHIAEEENHEEEQVNLAKAIPVLIVYTTASVAEDGKVHFFKDIYGYDESLDKLCCQAYASRK